jgi:NADPH2:quinone reductase
VEAAKAAGADEGLVYPSAITGKDEAKTFGRALKDLGGADVVYDPVGGAYAEPALRALNWNGRYLVIGFAAGDIPSIPLNLTLVKNIAILGVYWGAWTMRDPKGHAANMKELSDLWQSGQIDPRIHAVYPFDRATEAMADLAERRAKGKVVVSLSA